MYHFSVKCIILVLFASFCVIYVIVVLFESFVCCVRHSSFIHKHLFCFSLLFIFIFIHIHCYSYSYLYIFTVIHVTSVDCSVITWTAASRHEPTSPAGGQKHQSFSRTRSVLSLNFYMDTTFWAERQRRAKLPRRNDSAFSRAHAQEYGIRSCAR